MNPAELDALIHSQLPDGGHGDRNCPNCGLGFMQYVVAGSIGLYGCAECKWLEFNHGPWKQRVKPTEISNPNEKNI